MPTIPRTTTLVRRAVGRPVASRRVPAQVPLLIERYQVLFDSLEIPPLPAPVFMVQTGGKPIAYRGTGEARRSIPGLVTLQPRGVGAQASLRGVGEAYLVFFHDERRIPAWALGIAQRETISFANEVIVALTRRLMQASDERGVRASYLRTLGDALLAELEDAVARAARGWDAAQLPAGRSGLRVAHSAIRHIDQNLAEPLRVGELAALCGVGSTSFSAQFRSATGQSPYAYIRRKRIERAGELLRTSALSVREVAELTGFRGQSHFSVAFAQEHGLAPSAYRLACREAGRKRGQTRFPAVDKSAPRR